MIMNSNTRNYRFLFFKTKEAFEEMLTAGYINGKSIVFIEGNSLKDRAIWTHGVYFSPNMDAGKAKGLYDSYDALITAWPNPNKGDWAIVGTQILPGDDYTELLIYTCEVDGEWKVTDMTYGHDDIDFNGYIKWGDVDFNLYLPKADADNKFATKDELSNFTTSFNYKFNTLKTINNISLIGPGNINISEGGVVDLSDYVTKSYLEEYISNITPGGIWRFGDRFPIILSAEDESISELREEILSLRQQINNINIPLGCNCPNHVFLTLEQYDALEEYDNNTIYFILEHEYIEGAWQFGERFPIILT